MEANPCFLATVLACVPLKRNFPWSWLICVKRSSISSCGKSVAFIAEITAFLISVVVGWVHGWSGWILLLSICMASKKSDCISSCGFDVGSISDKKSGVVSGCVMLWMSVKTVLVSLGRESRCEVASKHWCRSSNRIYCNFSEIFSASYIFQKCVWEECRPATEVDKRKKKMEINIK